MERKYAKVYTDTDIQVNREIYLFIKVFYVLV